MNYDFKMLKNISSIHKNIVVQSNFSVFIYYKIGFFVTSRDGVVAIPLHSSKRCLQEGVNKGKRIYQKKTFILGFFARGSSV
jgi:hypothetical protein